MAAAMSSRAGASEEGPERVGHAVSMRVATASASFPPLLVIMFSRQKSRRCPPPPLTILSIVIPADNLQSQTVPGAVGRARSHRDGGCVNRTSVSGWRGAGLRFPLPSRQG